MEKISFYQIIQDFKMRIIFIISLFLVQPVFVIITSIFPTNVVITKSAESATVYVRKTDWLRVCQKKKAPEQKNFIYMKSLGSYYTEDSGHKHGAVTP